MTYESDLHLRIGFLYVITKSIVFNNFSVVSNKRWYSFSHGNQYDRSINLTI